MRTLTLAKRIVKQISGDKRTLGLLFAAPVFVLYLLSIILNSSVATPHIKAVSIPPALMEKMKPYADIEEVTDESVYLDKLRNKEIDALLVYKDSKITITLEGSETSITTAVKKSVSQGLSDYMKDSFSSNPKLSSIGIKFLDSEFVYLNGSDNMSTFDTIAPLMMGFFIFFFVFLLAGVSFLRERISGTLDRLLASPIKRIQVVLGYFIGFGVFVTIQTIVIQLFMVYGLHITIKGSPFLVLLINLLLAAGSLSLGTLLSAFAKNEFQLIQFVPIVIVPQILFCGLFSLREAPFWVSILSKLFPLTYGANALRDVVIRGAVFSDISKDILIIFLYAVLFIILNSLALKKYRKL
ncbi:MAG: ABC transporter permease [Clostridiaceae bacterium]